ncbi:hypothetical protein ABEF95_002011 [Exophiala dermatitidis]
MCVTEKWFYRECGCHYDHPILCGAYRARHVLSAQNSQPNKPDLWFGESRDHSNEDPLALSARPPEPQSCPSHQTVERSFLNQICEDCLMAELHPTPSQPTNPTVPATALVVPGHGEGLIWDSEVKVEIHNENSDATSSTTTPHIACLEDGSRDDDRRILESHIEVQIEVDSYSVSAEEPSSPLSLKSHGEDSSQSSSIPTSPMSPDYSDRFGLTSTAYKNKRYGLTFDRPVVTDFDDADNESDSSLELPLRSSSSAGRGRSLQRANVKGAVRCPSGPDSVDSSSKGKPHGSGVSRFKTLRSFSNSLIPTPKSKDERNLFDNRSTVSLAPSSTSTKSKPRSLFRGFRARKASPLIAESIEAKPVLLADAPHETIQAIKSQQTIDNSPRPPRKSSLKSWAFLKLHDRKDKKRSNGFDSPNRLRSLAPSPTGSWSRKQLGSEKEYSQLSDSASENESIISDEEHEAQVEVIEEGRASPVVVIPGLPKPSVVSTEQTSLEEALDFELELDDLEGRSEDQTSECDNDDDSYRPYPCKPIDKRLNHWQSEQAALRDSWPLRTEMTKPAKTEPRVLLRTIARRPADKRSAEGDAGIEPTSARESEQADNHHNLLTPLLRPEQGPGPADAATSKRPTFPPRKSSLKTRLELRRKSRPLSECDVPVPATVPPSC